MKDYLSLIKFSHTVFALPFALVGFFLGVYSGDVHTFDWRLLGLVLLCMVFARSAAMAFNRYTDRKIDAQNTRTQIREIPAGVISARAALIFVILCALAFVTTTWFINRLCFFLSPVALLVTLGYSYTKRFTALSHLVLGLGLSLAPVGAYLAVTGQFHLLPCLLGGVVMLWVAGFDIIYALQDIGFDTSHGLKSIPASLGADRALLVAKVIHGICAVLLALAVWMMFNNYRNLGWLTGAGAVIFLIMLISQHRLVKPNDLSRVNLAFFTTNGIASVVFGTLCIADLLI